MDSKHFSCRGLKQTQPRAERINEENIKEKTWILWAHTAKTQIFDTQLTPNGKKKEKQGFDRNKESFLRNLHQWTGQSVEELFHTAKDRIKYREIVMEIIIPLLWP